MAGKTFETPYEAGYDAGMNGASVRNSHYGWFGTKERMEEWSKGNKAGSAQREADRFEQRKRRLKSIKKDR